MMKRKHLLMMLLMAVFMPWSANGQTQITVCNGSATNDHVPFYGEFANVIGCQTEFIIPATTLGIPSDKEITSMRFYAASGANSWKQAIFQVYLKEVDETIFTPPYTFYGTQDATLVYQDSLQVNNASQLVINFSNNYYYHGGNLLVRISVSSPGKLKHNQGSAFFYGYSTGPNPNPNPYIPNPNPVPVPAINCQAATGSIIGQAFLPKTTFIYEDAPCCPSSHNLAAIMSEDDGTIATLTWTENGTAESWTLQYGTNREFVEGTYTEITDGFVVNGSNVTYDLTNLSSEIIYFARVKSHCGGECGDSDWSNMCSFPPTTPSIVLNHLVNESSNIIPNAGYVPFYTQKIRYGTHSQFIIPADSLENMVGGTVIRMTFRTNTQTRSWKDAAFKVYLKEVDYEAFDNNATMVDWGSLDEVYYGSLSIVRGHMVVKFDNAFTYNGGNLLIGFQEFDLPTSAVNTNRVLWYGTESTTRNFALYAYSSSAGNAPTTYGPIGFLPEVSFDYLPTAFSGKAFVCKGNWDDANKWIPVGVPTSNEDDVVIVADASIPSGCVAMANNIIFEDDATLTIADGGQLQHSNNITATMKKDIAGYTHDRDHYYLLGFPILSTIEPTLVTNMVTTYGIDYDLYTFDQTQESNEWVNQKDGTHTNEFMFSPSKGYLYARSESTTLSATGELNPNNVDFPTPLDYDETAAWAGWNLVANPFTCNAYIGRGFYRVTEGASASVLILAEGAIAPLEGVFVKATDTNDGITFSRNQPTRNGGILDMSILRKGSRIDLARVHFNEGRTLEKFQLNPNHTKIFIPQNGKDYAIVNADNMGEMPLSFKAESDGTYTLCFNAEEVTFAYLHLIDNITGTETDLLASPSYSFEAKTTDYASRFKLVFICGDADVDNDFAFFSNGNFVINNEGNATLQVVDLMGRIVKSENINGCANMNINAAPGVYMLRLVNGENVKIQKVVVR